MCTHHVDADWSLEIIYHPGLPSRIRRKVSEQQNFADSSTFKENGRNWWAQHSPAFLNGIFQQNDLLGIFEGR